MPEFLVVHSWQNGTRCRDGVNVLWCRSHLDRLVFERSIPTCACFRSENFFVTLNSRVQAMIVWLKINLPYSGCSQETY